MPPPLSDEEMIARFTPLEREFHAWDEANQRTFEDVLFDPFEMDRLLRQKWPDPNIRKQYHAWSKMWYDRGFQEMEYRITTDEFIDMVRNTDFKHPASHGKLLWTMDMCNPPFILLGEGQIDGIKTGYALRIHSQYLWPNRDDRENERGVVDRSILAINRNVHVQAPGLTPQEISSLTLKNTTPSHHWSIETAMTGTKNPSSRGLPAPSTTSAVPSEVTSPGLFKTASSLPPTATSSQSLTKPLAPKRRRQFNESEESTRSTDSQDIEHVQSFVFGQLGQLYSFAGPNWASTRESGNDAMIHGPWKPERYGVVVEVNSNGRPAGGVWIIYNFFEVDPNSKDDTRRHIRVYQDQEGHPFPHIGCPADAYIKKGFRFTLAKIANSLDELRVNEREFMFDIGCSGVLECQLVRAKVVHNGTRIVPQFVRDGEARTR